MRPFHLFRQFLLSLMVVLIVPTVAWAQRGGTKTRIQVTSDPQGAAVYVDAAIERAGNTPVTVNLTRGDHRIRLVLDGYATEEQSVTVGSSRQTLSFRMIPMARVEITAASDTAQGATVNIDGEAVGTVPITHALDPGRHQVEVERQGHETYSRWLEVSAGQSYSLAVALQPSTAQRGTLLVGGAVSGATVTVDGQPQGVTPAVIEVAVGQHVVVVSPEGMTPHTETVTVAAGARTSVDPTFGAASGGGGGSLRVLTRPGGATILVDGEEAGTAPVTVERLMAGSHVVEARLSGHESSSTRVTVEAGRRETLQLDLTRSTSTGTLRVTCDIEGAQVLLDGRPIGAAPLTESNVTTGAHQLLVRAPGHADWQQQVQVSGGQEIAVHATPQPAVRTGFISVTSDAPGAEVLIDGAVVGNAPLTNHEVTAGQHNLEVRASGFQTFTRTVAVAAGANQAINASLTAGSGAAEAGEGTEEGEGEDDGEAEGEDGEGEGEDDEEEDEEEEERREEEDSRTRFVYAASALRPYKLGIDASWGWPFFVGSYRLSLGVFRNLDVGIEGRSALRFNEIDVHVRYGLRLLSILGIGIELQIGGGWGDYDRSAFVFGLTATQGVEFERWSLVARERLWVFSDNYADPDPTLELRDDRNVMFFVGIGLEIRLANWLHLFMVVDYAPAQDPRRVFCWDEWNTTLVGDTEIGCTSKIPGGVAIEGRIGLGMRFL